MEQHRALLVARKTAQAQRHQQSLWRLYQETIVVLRGLESTDLWSIPPSEAQDGSLSNPNLFYQRHFCKGTAVHLLPTHLELPDAPTRSNSPLTPIESQPDDAQDGPSGEAAAVQGSSKDLKDDEKESSETAEAIAAQLRPKVQPFKEQSVNTPAEQALSSTVTLSQLQLKHPAPPMIPTPSKLKPSELPVASMSAQYVQELPDLPFEVLRQRASIGGLLRRKKERDERNSGLSGGMELYRTGLVKATYASVRSYMGQGPPEAKTKNAIRPAKAILTKDWNVAVEELKGLRAMERIEALKAQNAWSFRQIKKQKMPAVGKTHWDYLLEEMKWLQTDVKQERRWKVAAAHQVACAVKEYWSAPPERREHLCVTVCPPKPRLEEDDPVNEDQSHDVQMKEAPLSATSTTMDLDHSPPTQEKPFTPVGVPVETAEGVVLPITGGSLSYNQLVMLRAPLFQQPDTATTFSLSQLPLDHELPKDAVERYRLELINGLAPDLPAYEGPTAPTGDERVDRRLEESSSHYSRITPVTHLMEDKPLLLSTLQPSKRRRLSEDGEWRWGEMADIYGDDLKEPVERPESLPVGSHLFAGRRSRDPTHAPVVHAIPPPPGDYKDTRAAMLDWTEAEDNILLALSKQYYYNWQLVADVFNATTVRVSTDERDAWDVYDRWNRRFGAGSQASLEQLEKDKRAKQLKFGGSRKDVRHLSLYEAVRTVQKRREALPPKTASNAPRRVVLSSHETHTQPARPSMSAYDISKYKSDREQQQRLLVDQQHLLRRQTQQAALLQQAQLQAQTQSQQQQNGRVPLPPNHPLAQQPPRPPSQASQASQHSGSPVMGPGQLPPNMQTSPEAVNAMLASNNFASPSPGGQPHPGLQFNNLSNIPAHMLAMLAPQQQASVNQQVQMARIGHATPSPAQLLQVAQAQAQANGQGNDPAAIHALQQRLMMAVRHQQAQNQSALAAQQDVGNGS